MYVLHGQRANHLARPCDVYIRKEGPALVGAAVLREITML